MHSFERLPRIFICDRWTKNTRSKGLDQMNAQKFSSKQNSSFSSWRYSMARKFYTILLSCEENMEARSVVEEVIQTLMENTTKNIQHEECSRSESRSTTSGNVIFDLEHAKIKGRSKRIKNLLLK